MIGEEMVFTMGVSVPAVRARAQVSRRPCGAVRVPVRMNDGAKEIKRSGGGNRNQKGRWIGMDEDISDDQADITRGKGMVDAKFQQGDVGGTGVGTHESIQFQESVQSNLENKFKDTRETMSWADALAAAQAEGDEEEE